MVPWTGQLELPFDRPPAPPLTLRRIQLGARIVEYALVRGRRRRTLGLTVDQRGLRVGAPRGLPLRDIEGFLRTHGDWIQRKLDNWQSGSRRQCLSVGEGATIPVLGRPHALRIRHGATRVRWGAGTITLQLGPADTPREVLVGALRQRAIEVFSGRAEALAPILSLSRPRIALSDAQTRWGSCSVRGGVRLNWRLVHLPARLIDYVVAHELAHLRQMNHSPAFWSLVERMVPDYRELRAEIVRIAPQLPNI